MRIEIKLYGDLKKHAPGDQNPFALTVEPGTTLGDIHDKLAIPQEFQVSLINGRPANRKTPMNAGDTLVVFPPIAGG
jgi:molybdopterin converting factor small subunit